jgi:hypothetical protein
MRERTVLTRWAAPLAALAVLVAVAITAVQRFDYQIGVDFYHLWGVGLAREALGGNPYVATHDYAEFLNRVSEASASARLHYVNGFRRAIEPTGTPLFYATFAALPRDYDFAFGGMAVALWLAFIASVWALARWRGAGHWSALALAGAVALVYQPLMQDVKCGNVNALQLAALVAWMWASRSRPGRWDVLLLPALVVIAAFKPNLLLVAAALALHYAATRPLPRVARAVALCVPAALLAYAGGAIFFRSAAAWSDWYRYTHGMNGGTLLYAAEGGGNQSLAMMMAERSGALGPYGYGAFLGASVVFLLACSLTSFGKDARAVRPALDKLVRDPWCMASAGIVLTFASSPLLWPHYLVWAVIPMAWLFRRAGRWDLATTCTVVSFLALCLPVLDAMQAAGWTGVLQMTLLLSWVPLVIGLCARFAHAAAQARESSAVAQPDARQTAA